MKILIAENIRISLISIRSHILRTVLTMLIIAFGIMALVGILTAIESIKGSISSNFARMGSNTFSIRNHGIRMHGGGERPKDFRNITYREAMEFKERFNFPAMTSISTVGTRASTVKYASKKTNPNIVVFGIDGQYLSTSGQEIEYGRNFSNKELENGANVILVGSEIVKKLFTDSENALDKEISVGPQRFKIIGVLKEKGSSMGFSGDKSCLIPLKCLRQFVAGNELSYTIEVMVPNNLLMETAIGEATGTFRVIRKVLPGDNNNFAVEKSDNLAQMLIENISFVTLAATIIGLITLLGAAIGLMNIMLVSVTERTREIGIRKAMGATSNIIRNQFLVEAVVIGVMGGLLGIFFGILIGNIMSLILGSSFVVPWLWIFSGIALCILVGLVSGIIPALKAARLNPIDALRYE
ncbi:MAG TPA: ABC transporter permease [Bacteroidales bacterium]|jgi:putative ABC transport system permease protein|nr:ABC transporter permease [Bacteroidales bacterium]HNZ41744.1 ABC transporter permease [Bacteroidales bacterium]HPB24775.1 ABC transporter permease [Bacteroidales bacterium]HPI30670.1 ABC transporter permease [Bacteroidales bacterium]HQN15572.1 ABC transporter permease [Bacteroidales bacterium]